MFDFAWTEIALIGVVALVAIGPKDMPVAIRTITSMIKKARRMAAEFQTHVDDMVRDADLQEVRNSISEIRNFDFKGTVERAVDPDGSMRSTLATNPLAPDPVIRAHGPTEPTAADASAAGTSVADGSVAELVRPVPVPGLWPPAEQAAEAEPAPWFIPPQFAARPEPPPAFVPPNAARRSKA